MTLEWAPCKRVYRDFRAIVESERGSDELAHLFAVLKAVWYSSEPEISISVARHCEAEAALIGEDRK